MKIRSGAARLLLLLALSYLFLLIWRPGCGVASHGLRVTFLDVGQGDAIVIESPSGKVMVVDAGRAGFDGGDDEGRRVVAPYLRFRGIARIDTLVLTHPDSDHIGGAAGLLHEFTVGRLLDNGAKDDSRLVTGILTAAHEAGVPVEAAQRGQTLDFGDGVTARVLSPTPALLLSDKNDSSIVLRIEYGRTALLLTGDAEEKEEDDMLRSGQPVQADVLKAGHHGSRSSTSPPFLAAVHPHVAILSVGAHNIYGHPAPEIVSRLQAARARIYRTDRQGAITCLSDGVTVQVDMVKR